MGRVNLDVPYEDKDEAKRRGAKWDPARRVWFLPAGSDPSRFSQWLATDDGPNVRASSYFIAAATLRCRRCHIPTAVHGFMLPAGHETRYEDDDPDEDSWEIADEPTLLSYVDYLAPAVAARMVAVTAHYRPIYGPDSSTLGWVNFCEHCEAQLADHETYSEPGEAFLAFTIEAARRITLVRVGTPFAAHCGSFSVGVTLFQEMRIL